MAKAKESKRTDLPTVLWVPLLVALVTGIFGIGIAKISAGGDHNGGGTTSPTTTPINLHLVTWGSKAVDPSPHRTYVFIGEGATGKDDVYVLGKYISSARLGSKALKEVSPPGSVRADGTWRIEWTFPDEPAATDFTVFAVPPSSPLYDCPNALECTPASGATSSVFPSQLDVSELLGAQSLDRRLIADSVHITIAAAPLP